MDCGPSYQTQPRKHMTLELGYEDLKPEHRHCAAKETTFIMFLPEAQKAIEIVGKGTFYNGTLKTTFNHIYPPK